MKRKTRLRKRDVLAITGAVLLALAGLYLGAQWLENQNANPEPRGDYRLRYKDEQRTVNGQTYRLRKNLTTILLIGVDQDADSEESPRRSPRT